MHDTSHIQRHPPLKLMCESTCGVAHNACMCHCAKAHRVKEFDTFFELAAAEAKKRGEPPLDVNDSKRFIGLYQDMIVRGDRDAIWRFHVFVSCP